MTLFRKANWTIVLDEVAAYRRSRIGQDDGLVVYFKAGGNVILEGNAAVLFEEAYQAYYNAVDVQF